MNGFTTKNKILYSALNLFSTKGYDGVGVDDIASLAGIKGPSIYRYFKSKRDILDTLLDEVNKKYCERMDFNLNTTLPSTLDELKQFTLDQLKYTMNNEIIIKTRKLLTIEQFRNEKIAKIKTEHNLTLIEKLYTKIFENLVKNNVIKESDIDILTFVYVSPITIMIQLCDREDDKRDFAQERIIKHINHFINIYS